MLGDVNELFLVIVIVDIIGIFLFVFRRVNELEVILESKVGLFNY